MAIVPKAQRSQQVQTAPIGPQRLNASPDAFGAGLGRALQGAGNDLAQHAEEMQQREDVTKATDAYVKLSDAWREKSAELKQRQGLDAKNITMDAEGALKDLYETYSKDLSPRQLERLSPLYNQLRSGQLNSYSTYEAGQMRSAHDAQLGAIAETAILEALDTPTPEVVRRSLTNIDTATREQLRGQSPEVVDAAILARKSKLHAGIIGGLQVKDPHRAKAYLEANKVEIDGATEMALRKSLETASQAHDASAIAGRVWDETSGEGVPQMRERVYALTEDPDIRKAAMAELKTRHSEDMAAQKEEQDAAFNELYDYGEQPGVNIADLMQDPRWSLLLPNQQNALKDAASSGSSPVRTDMGTYLDLMDKIETDPQGFTDVNLREYTSLLSVADMKDLRQKQTALRAGEEVRTDTQLVNGALDLLKIDRGASASDKNKQRTEALWRRYNAEVQQSKKELGREPNTTEKQAILDRLSMQAVTSKGFFEHRKSNFLLSAEGVPDSAIDDLSAYLGEKGVPVTEENLRAAYEAWRNE